MSVGSSKTLSDGERLAWLRLIRSENVGPLNFCTLLEHYGDAETALEALPELARSGGMLVSDDVSNDALHDASRGWDREPSIIGQSKASPIGLVSKP